MTNNQINSLFLRVYNSDTYYITDFLNEAEKDEFITISNRYTGIHLEFYGGFIGAEYEKCAIISNNFSGVIDYKLDTYEIIYNHRFLDITHRNILGTVMSLGIERNRIGDIVLKDNHAYIAIDQDISKYIIENFTGINHTPIELVKVTEEISFYKEGKAKTIFVTSDRLDVIIASGFDISRKKALELVDGEMVKVNQKKSLKAIQKIKSCDIISVKSLGRLEIKEFKGVSRSDNLILDIIIYR